MNREELQNIYCQALTHFNQELGPEAIKVSEKAIEEFSKRGLPHRRVEDWKYTTLHKSIPQNPKLGTLPSTVSSEKLNSLLLESEYTLVLWNGNYQSDLTNLPEGMKLVQEKKEYAGDLDLIESLNTAGKIHNIKLTIEKNTSIDKPLHIIHYNDSSADQAVISPFIDIVANMGSKACILESFHSQDNQILHVPVTRLSCQENTNIEHVKLQDEGAETTHLGKLKAHVLGHGNFQSFTFSVGANVSRNQIEVDLDQAQAETSVHGLFAINGEQHCDNFSHINHNSEHTNSSQLYKGILDGKSHGIFTGKIIVGRDSQKVDSNQLNKNLLLSKQAHIDTRPQLEVYADDVKCAHGATIGQLSEEQLFYLQTRSITKERALQMLSHGFGSDALEHVQNVDVRSHLTKILFERFEYFSVQEIK